MKQNFYLMLGVFYFAFFLGSIVSAIGEKTSGTIITWYDAIWVPIIVVILPFYLGYNAGKRGDIK